MMQIESNKTKALCTTAAEIPSMDKKQNTNQTVQHKITNAANVNVWGTFGKFCISMAEIKKVDDIKVDNTK